MQVDIKKIKQAYPNTFDNKDTKVYFMGYHPSRCPFTRKTTHAIGRVPDWRKPEGHTFVQIDDSNAASLKQKFNNTSWPIVLVRDESGEFHHIGGGSDAEDLAREKGGEFQDYTLHRFIVRND